MRHQNSVFHDLLKLIPWTVFDRLVEEHGADDLVRKFKTRHQLIALVYGQLAGGASLREIEAIMASHQARLYHLGGKVPRRSTFADANRIRSPLVFSGLFQHMLGATTRAVRRQMDDVILLVDSTGLHLAGIGTQWARFSADVCGAKAHVIYDPDSSTIPTSPTRSITRSAPPMSTTSPPPRRCRLRRAPPMCSISAITITAGGPSSMPPAAGS